MDRGKKRLRKDTIYRVSVLIVGAILATLSVGPLDGVFVCETMRQGRCCQHVNTSCSRDGNPREEDQTVCLSWNRLSETGLRGDWTTGLDWTAG